MESLKIEKSQLKDINSNIKNIDEINNKWELATKNIDKKIIVLDDDPTGIQTVHSVPVYTSWDYEEILKIFNEESKVVYILTNSRAFREEETEQVHRKIAKDVLKASKETKKEFIVISRGDSTLRGHYPLETQSIYEELSRDINIDGEIIIPFFLEGGRYTIDNIHYVEEEGYLIPAGETEFAKDPTFGYKSSNLKSWINEKSMGRYLEKDIKSISLEDLKNQNYDRILEVLMNVKNFNKIIVNATEYIDLKVFTIALSKAINNGKNFIFRTAASFVQTIGGIHPKPLLNHKTLFTKNHANKPGIIIIGSFVGKTTRQLNQLKELEDINFLEWNVKNAISEEAAKKETNRIIDAIEKSFKVGKDVCVYTSREYQWSDIAKNSEKNLEFSLRVSEGLVNVIKGLKTNPGYVLAKGGITSSHIGVQGLEVKKAIVLGQVKPGIPVWGLGPESRYPDIPYIIFPGNVGHDDTLKEIARILIPDT